jgi:hypothetical protein
MTCFIFSLTSQSRASFRGAAFVRTRAGIVAEFLTTYIPEFMLRLSLHLPIGPTRALLTFKTTTDQIMEQKIQEYRLNQSETNDLLSTMCALCSALSPFLR